VIAPKTDIVEALRQNNAVVFERLFNDYYERLCNYANSFLDDMDESEEVVQSTFITLWEKHDTLDIHTSVKSYLYQAVHNQSLNKIKHDQVKQSHFEFVTYQNNAEAPDAHQTMVGKELNELITLAVDSLPLQCRTVFMLSRFENFSYAEIAEQLSLSVKTVENHIGKALRIMRTQLADYLPLIIYLLLSAF
jgi:RNA polymerase sigma-70 factor, ECF subfamily